MLIALRSIPLLQGTLWRRSQKKNGVNVEDIARQNNISDPNKIYPGQSISIDKSGNITSGQTERPVENPIASK
uniref:LysM peptidoglycan-binding domain-containing protein n=1 Tax=Klebsiella pneumoniae TaxID=573 RepID=UPI001D0DA396